MKLSNLIKKYHKGKAIAHEQEALYYGKRTLGQKDNICYVNEIRETYLRELIKDKHASLGMDHSKMFDGKFDKEYEEIYNLMGTMQTNEDGWRLSKMLKNLESKTSDFIPFYCRGISIGYTFVTYTEIIMIIIVAICCMKASISFERWITVVNS